jgi:predicted  nucleic acid-binding Zn-ribbon protein
MKPIQVKCTGCGKVYAVANASVIGKTTKCKQCGATFVIQAMEEAGKKPVAARAGVGGKPPAAPPPRQAPAAGQEEEEDDEDYPDTEPTISVSAYEAQKLREQLRKGLLAPDGAPAGEGDDGQTPSAEHTAAARGPTPARPPRKAAAGPSPLIWVLVGALVVIAIALGAFYLLRPS